MKESLDSKKPKLEAQKNKDSSKLLSADNRKQELPADVKKAVTEGCGLEKSASKSYPVKDKIQEQISNNQGKAVAGKTEESKGVKTTIKKNEDVSAEMSGKIEESKGVKITIKKNEDVSAEMSERNKDHRRAGKSKDYKELSKDSNDKDSQRYRENKNSLRDKSNKDVQRDKDHKESQKNQDESQKDKSCKEAQQGESKESQKVRGHKESPKDKNCKEARQERENKESQKEATKGKESSSSTRKPEKKQEKEFKQSKDTTTGESGKKREKELEKGGVSSEINAGSKKPKLGSETDNKDQKKTEFKGDPRVLRNLSDMKQPVLGIEDISLYGNDGNWVYQCKPCSVTCGSIDIRHHLLGRKHRAVCAVYYQQKTSTNSISQENKSENRISKPVPTVTSTDSISQANKNENRISKPVPTVTSTDSISQANKNVTSTDSISQANKNETSTNSVPQASKNENNFSQPIPTIKSNREKRYMPYGNKFRDDSWVINQPQLREERNFREVRPPHFPNENFREVRPPHFPNENFREERPPHFPNENFREERPPHFPNERSYDWKQAYWNDCCNSFLKITMDGQDNLSRYDLERPKERQQREKSSQDRFSKEFVPNVRKPLVPCDQKFGVRGPSQFQQAEYVSHPQFLHPQHSANPSHFQEPVAPPAFQMARQPPNFQHSRYPPDFQQFSIPQQFFQHGYPFEPQFQKLGLHPQLLEDSVSIKDQKSQARQLIVIPTDDKAPAKQIKDITAHHKPVEDNKAPSTKSSEAALDIINLMIQDYLKNELQKLPSQLQKILCESTRTDDSKRLSCTVSDIEVAKNESRSNNEPALENDPSEIKDRNSVSSSLPQSIKEGSAKAVKRVTPEDVATSFDQHSYKNIENMETIPFIGVVSSSQDPQSYESTTNKPSNDNINWSSHEPSDNQRNNDTSFIKDEALNPQKNASASVMNATNNCFEQFIKSWIEHTGTVPIRSVKAEPLDKSPHSKENITDRKGTDQISDQALPDFSNIDHAELGRQVASFLSKHSASWSENIGNILVGRTPESSLAPLRSKVNTFIEKELINNAAETTQYSNRNVNPLMDQNNRGHTIHGMNREMNPADAHQFSNENYRRIPDNLEGGARNVGNNPSSQQASYWVASGRDGVPTRIYFDDMADNYQDRSRNELARGIESMDNTHQERRMNIEERERQWKDSNYNRRGGGALPFRSAHSLSFLDLLNQHRNDPVFIPGINRSSVPKRKF